MGRKAKAERVTPTEGARVHMRGRPHLGCGIISCIYPNGTWCVLLWDDTASLPFICHIDELEVAK